jgi:prophage antirepressor-like protein
MTLQTFHFEGTPVRDVLIDGDPWWVGRDVCQALGIENSSDALGSIPDDEKDGVGITDPIGRAQTAVCVNEPGLYRLIFKSRKPEAERFKRWVLHEVLPQIRKTGGYHAAPVDAGFGADGTVPVAAYIALLHDKIAMLEEKARPKPKRKAPERISADEKLEIRRLAQDGMSGMEIARQTGRSSASISGILQACPPLPDERPAAGEGGDA